MRVLFILEHYYPYLGGAEKLFRQLAEALAADGHTVTVLTTLHQDDLPTQESINGVNIQRVRCRNRFLFTIWSLPSALRLARIADVIHTTTYNAGPVAWWVGRWRKVPVIITFHEYWGRLWWELPFLSYLQRTLFYTFEQLVRRLPFHRYIAVSQATAQRLIEAGVAPSKISQIYNGLAYEQFVDYQWSPASEQFELLYYGRLGVSKGLDLLLPAWADFVKTNPKEKARLTLVIPRYPLPLFNRVLALVEDLKITGDIRLLHELPRNVLYQTIAASSAVAIPSYSEGFCFVAAEAMAIGVPIVHSGRGALEEVVSGTHILVEAQTVAAWRDGIKKAFQSKWTEKPLRLFPLAEAVKAYRQLINSYG